MLKKLKEKLRNKINVNGNREYGKYSKMVIK